MPAHGAGAEEVRRQPHGAERRGYSRQIPNQEGIAAGRLALAWQAVPASVAEARQAVAEFAAASGVGSDTVAAVRVAVAEAVNNAVVHAYLDAPEAGPVHVTAECEEDAIWVTVSDEGRGMLARADSPGIGLGLPLIARMTAGFELHERDGGGTELKMRFGL
jgi:serine/threonine-protein kinase RsbW/stage II sporulation protein AB (anti-sigma F factor)